MGYDVIGSKSSFKSMLIFHVIRSVEEYHVISSLRHMTPDRQIPRSLDAARPMYVFRVTQLLWYLPVVSTAQLSRRLSNVRGYNYHYTDVIMGTNSVSNHQPRDCLLNRLFRRTSKKTSTLSVTGLCAGNSPGTGKFPAQMARYAEMFPFEDVIMVNTQFRGFETSRDLTTGRLTG